MFDPIDGTTNYAHGLPIFCASLALEIDGVAEVAAVYDPNRRELFTAERGGGAFLNGAPLRVSSAARWSTRCWSPAFPTTSTRASTRSSGCSRAFVGQARAVRRLGSAAIDLCYVAAGRHGRLLGKRPQAVGHRRRRADRGGGRRPRDRHGGEPFTSRGGHVLATNGHLHDAMLDGDSRRFATVVLRQRTS